MTGAEFMNICTLIGLVLIAAATALVLVRFVRGPSLGDRILCLDTITMLGAGAIGIFALRSALFVYVDMAVALGLVSFLSTAALARFLLSHWKDAQ